MRIEQIAAALDGKNKGSYWIAKCPAHADDKASLSLSVGRDGRLLARCFTGCTWDAIKAAIEAKGLKVDTKEGDDHGLPADAGDPGVRTIYRIKGIDNVVVAEHVRIERKSGKTFIWQGPDGKFTGLKNLGLSIEDMPLYNTEILPKGKPDCPVIICEGEKAADALVGLGVIGLGTVTGASAAPGEKPLGALKGHPVYLWPDNDDPGIVHMTRISKTLQKLGIKTYVIEWSKAPKKGDAADFIASGGTRDDLSALAKAAKAKATSIPGVKLLYEGVNDALELLDRFQVGDFSDRVPTGILELDKKLMGGLRKGSMTLLGAPPGFGKTTIAQQIASNAARLGPVLLVTPEMDLSELAEREIIRESGVSKSDRVPWMVKPGAVEAHMKASAKIMTEQRKIYVVDKNEITMDDVAEAADAIPGLRLIVVDYAQQVAGDPMAKTQRYLQVGNVGLQAIELGRKYNVPVLVASQVNRNTEGKDTTYSFRETAILEHKAHTVLIFDVKWEDVKEAGRRSGARRVEWARFICTKQRGGSPFFLEVEFDARVYMVRDKFDEDSMPYPSVKAGPKKMTPPPSDVSLPYKD